MRFFLLSIVVIAALVAGCGGIENASANTSYIQAKYDADGHLTQLSYDRNKNGRVDTVAFMDGARFLRIEIDSDENGLVDRWEYYGANQELEKVGSSEAHDGRPDMWAYQDANGGVVKIERSARRDGTVSRTEYYENGTLTRIEEDSDGDGKLDRWESYAEGSLRAVAFDTAGRGTPDRRLVYRADGALERFEVDSHGNGTLEPVR
jgi:hypothetical protein